MSSTEKACKKCGTTEDVYEDGLYCDSCDEALSEEVYDRFYESCERQEIRRQELGGDEDKEETLEDKYERAADAYDRMKKVRMGE